MTPENLASQRMSTPGRRFLPVIRSGERQALAYFFILLFLIIAGLAIGRGVANTLFLKRFGIEHLPWVFLVQGIGLAVASLFYASVSDRLRPERILNFILLLMVTLLLCLWGMAQTPLATWAHPPLYLLQEIASEILALHFSLYICSHFDNEQSKRLMPLAMAGGQLGELSGGLTLAVGAPLVGPVNMVWAWAGGGLLAWILVRAWHRHQGPTPRRIAVRTSGGMRQTLRQLRQGLNFMWPQRNSALAVFFTVIVLFMLSFLIKDTFVREFRSEKELATVFGLVTFIGGSVAFLVQITLTSQLIERFGVRRMNLVFPLSTLIVLSAFLSPFSLPAAWLGAFNRRVLLPSIRNPARSLMLQALPDYIQGRMRGITLAIVVPLAMVMAGLLIKGLRSDSDMIAAIGIGLGLLALYFAVRTNQDYQRTIIETLQERLFVPRDDLGPTAFERNEQLLDELVKGIEHEDEAMCEKFARILVDHFGSDAVPHILRRIARASHPCQNRLSRLIAPYLNAEHIPAWMARANASDPRSLATVLEVAFRGRWQEGRPHVTRCLESDTPRLAACGIIGALSYDDPVLHAQGERILGRMLACGKDEEMIAAMEVLTAMPNGAHLTQIGTALSSTNPRLRMHALHALHAISQPVTDARTMETLKDIYHSEDAWHLREACVKTSELLPLHPRISLLIDALDDPQPQVQKLAVALLTKQKADGTIETLLQAMRNWKLGVRGQIAALSVLTDTVPQEQLRQFALEYLDQASIYHAWLPAFDTPTPATELLGIVLRERVAQLTDLGLRALALGPNRNLAKILRAAMASDNRRQRMLCLELIEDFPDLEAGAQLRRLLQPPPAARELSIGTMVAELSRGADGWVAQCAQQWEPA